MGRAPFTQLAQYFSSIERSRHLRTLMLAYVPHYMVCDVFEVMLYSLWFSSHQSPASYLSYLLYQ